MVVAPIPWTKRTWALPFLIILAPSERYYHERKRQYKLVLRWARQMVVLVRRWLPNRLLLLTVNSTYAALDFLAFCQRLKLPVH